MMRCASPWPITATAEPRARGAVLPAGLEGDAAQHRRPHQQRLLQDQHEGGRNDVTGIAAGRIEQWHGQDLGRAVGGEEPSRRPALPRAVATEIGGDGSHRLGQALQRAAEDEEIGRIDDKPAGARHRPSRQSRVVPCGISRMAKTRRAYSSCCASASVSARTATWIASSASMVMMIWRLSSVRSLSTTAIGRWRSDLAEIGLRVEDAIEDRRGEHQTHDAAVGEDAADFAGDDAGEAVRRRSTGARSSASRGPRGSSCKPEPGEAAVKERQPREDGKGRAPRRATGVPRAA